MDCSRFVGRKLTKCPYCGSRNFSDIGLRREISSNYRILEEEISVNGEAYEVKDYIGKGGFGRVIHVMDDEENKSRALKVPFTFDQYFSNQQGNDEWDLEYSKNTLEKEIQAYSNIKNKICSSLFLDFYKSGEMTSREKAKEKQKAFPVFFMELAEGTLKDLVEREAAGTITIPFQEKQVIIENIMSAVSELHKVMVHRDLTPGNFFIVDRLNVAYVIGDLGTSKNLDETLKTIPTALAGKKFYIDPLIYLNDKNYRKDRRIDVYSMGITVCEVLMGVFCQSFILEDAPETAIDFEKEFLGTTVRENIEKYLQQEKKAGIIDELIEVLRRALTRDLKKRYQTIDEFKNRLFEVLDITGSLNREIREITFTFTVRLPFEESDDTALLNRIPVEKDTAEISLKNHRGVELDFVQFIPRDVEIKNTSLYSLTITGSSVFLNFRNRKFKSLISSMERVDRNLSGELHFQGNIYVIGVPA
jgi:serine/threonine protein kinase